MRVLYIENANLPTSWAHGYQIVKTCEALVRSGAEVQLVLPRRINPTMPKDVFAYYKVPTTFTVVKLPVIDFVPYVPFSLEKIPYLIERWTFLRSVRRRLSQPDRGDVWYTRDPRIAEALVRVPNARPVVVELHDAPDVQRPRWTVLKNRVSGWVVISQGLKRVLTDAGVPEDRIAVASDGFDAAEFSSPPNKEAARRNLGLPADQTVLLYSGQLFPWKGLDDLAPAFARLPAPCHLYVVGGQPEDIARIRRSIPESASSIHFVGQVPHADVLDWLAAADAAVLSTSAKHRIGREFTSPIKLFEYLAAGLPILASDVPSSREILDSTTSVFFAPDHAEGFLAAVQKFLSLSPAQRKDMEASARKQSAGYSWEQRGRRIAGYLSAWSKPLA